MDKKYLLAYQGIKKDPTLRYAGPESGKVTMQDVSILLNWN